MENKNNASIVKRFFIKQWKIIKKEFTSESPKVFIFNSFLVVLGAFIYAFGTSFFVVPMNLITGGITSIAILLNKYVNLSVDTLILIISWSFFVFGLFTLGLKYSIRSLLFTITGPLFIMMFQNLIDNVVVDGRHVLNILEINKIFITDDIQIMGDGLKALAYVAAAIFGGSLLGVGVGVAIMGGGSSGGTDVVNLLVRKYFHVKVGITSFIQDLIVILIGFFINDMNLITTCFGIIGSLLCSILIDKVSFGDNQFFVAFICTNKWESMNQKILEESARGTTLISMKGGYSKVDSYLIEICFDKRDYAVVKNAILKVDPNAFIQIMKASEIIGYGFTRKTPTVEEIKSLDVSDKEKEYYLLKSMNNYFNTYKNEDKNGRE